MEGKTDRTRVAVLLLCGVALACTIMYITADADVEETSRLSFHKMVKSFKRSAKTRVSKIVRSIHTSFKSRKSRSRVPRPSAVERAGGKDLSKVISFDVEKAGRIITNVPGKGHYVSGRVRLIKYFNAIEKKIAAEVSARKS